MRIKDLVTHPASQQTARLFFKINGNYTKFVDNDADLLIYDHKTDRRELDLYPHQFSLCIDLAHANNNKYAGWNQIDWLGENRYALVECTDRFVSNPNIISLDFMFNRSKAYYTDSMSGWYHRHPDDFLLRDISKPDSKTRMFLGLNKPNNEYRIQLYNLLSYYSGWQGDISKDQGLLSNRFDPWADIDHLSLCSISSTDLGYSPAHNSYYDDTFISVYVETITDGTSMLITEKTLDPMIKGHFILPFAASGFLEYLKYKGFRLPNFIDYGYDCISNIDQRWQAYQQELKRLLSLNMATWKQHWIDNSDILYYNRLLFTERDYDRVDLENLLEKHCGST